MERILVGVVVALVACAAPSGANLAGIEANPRLAPAAQRAPDRLDWLLIYWMCYDNNLEAVGPRILDMLEAGVTSPRVGVLVFADFRDTRGMRAIAITRAGRREERLETEASAREQTLTDALRWAGARYPAAHIGLVFLDHGGRLDQMCLDENPGTGRAEWLSPARVGPALAAARKQLPGQLELVFVQQCGKGSMETLYALREAAPWIMASQVLVGAPNYYYTGMLRDLSRSPEMSGRAVARAIMDHETPDMFAVYALLSSAALELLPHKLNPLLAPLLARPGRIAPPRLGPTGESGARAPVSFIAGRDEIYVDGPSLLRALYEANGIDPAPLGAFDEWVRHQLVVERRISPAAQERGPDLSGFSFMIPLTVPRLAGYRDTPLYKVTTLDEVIAKLMIDAGSATPPAQGQAATE